MSYQRYLKGFINQKKVLSALQYRELKTRISNVKFGFIGLILQPTGVLILFLIIFGIIRQRGVGDLDPKFAPIFLLCGIINYTLFFETVIRSLNSIQANQALFFYRQVKPIDTILSRSYVETMIFGIIYILLVIGIFLVFETFYLDSLPALLISYLLLAITSFASGTFLMIAAHRYEIIRTLVIFLQRPAFLLSGVFFSINDIPARVRPWLSWNPILQAIEISRKAFNKNYYLDSNIVSIKYLFSFSLVSCALALWVYFNNLKILRKL